MTEEQRKNLFSRFTEREDVKQDKVSIDTSLPKELESSVEMITRGMKDESNLTYEELIEECIKNGKNYIMKPETFDRLWNS